MSIVTEEELLREEMRAEARVHKDLSRYTDEQLEFMYPTVNPDLRRHIFANAGVKTSLLHGRAIGKKLNPYKKEAIKRMSQKISKHLNTQRFIEYFDSHIGVEMIGDTLIQVLMSDSEKTENKLKAVAEINKYAMVPSQAQEIKHEVDTTFDMDKRARLEELLNKTSEV